jgi:hypothetical protein
MYKCIFNYEISLNDCINSIDLIDDKVVFGTIMGDVILCRIDENNLLIKNNKKNSLSNNKSNISSKNNYSSKENSKNNLDNINEEITEDNNKQLPYIELDPFNKKNTFYFDNRKGEEEHENSYSKTQNEQINNISNINENNLNNSIKKEKNEKSNLRYNTNDKNNLTNNNIKENKISSNENNNSDNENKSIINDKLKKFSRVTQLITKSNENIPCIEFDTDDKINISIGDFEVICLKNISNFNINDENSTYDYFKIKNYKNDSQHIKYCEHCTCLMNSSNYLIIFTDYGDFNSKIYFDNFKYKNRNLRTFKTKSGKIEMSNFSVPFDFDGDRFLFLDYRTKEIRRICIHSVLNDKNIYEYNISKAFGHISHMKLISSEENKIFLCRNNNQCEIHLMDDNFTCIQSWEHIGKDVISSFVYIKESKLTEQFKKKLKSKKNNHRNDIKIDINYDNYIIKSNRTKSKKNKLYFRNKKSNLKFENLQGTSSILSINNKSLISSSYKGKVNHNKNLYRYNQPENYEIRKMKSMSQNNSSRREFNSSEKSDKNGNGIEIYNNRNIQNNIMELTNQYSFTSKNNNFILKKEKIGNKGQTTIKSYKDNDITLDIDKENYVNSNYYIITLDKNGNVNLYNNLKLGKIFNLYEIENIEEKYKKKEFFSVGFPYYIIMNEFYIAITTDHGLFVVSNI